MPGGPFFNCYPGPFSNVRCTGSMVGSVGGAVAGNAAGRIGKLLK